MKQCVVMLHGICCSHTIRKYLSHGCPARYMFVPSPFMLHTSAAAADIQLHAM